MKNTSKARVPGKHWVRTGKCPDKSHRALSGRRGSALITATVIAASLWAPRLLAQSGNFEVKLDNDKRISLNAENASVREILLDLEQKTGVKMNFVADPTERVSLTIESQTFENIIGKLAPDHLLVRGTENGKSVIRELIIISNDPTLSRGQTESNLPTGEPAPEIQSQTPPPQPVSLDQPQPASPDQQQSNPPAPSSPDLQNQPPQPPVPTN